MKKIIGLLRGSIFFTFASILEALAPLILAPFLTRYLSVYEYGIWAIFQSAVAFLRPMLGLALDDYIRIHYHRNDKIFIVQYIVTILLLSSLLVTFACIGLLLFGADISSMLVFPEENLWTIIICAWLYALFYIGLTYHQFSGNYTYYSTIHFLQAAITIITTIVCVLLGWGWKGAVIGKMVGLSCSALLAFILLFRNVAPFKFKWHFNHFGKLLSFGLCYLPNSMLPTIMALIDRTMLSHAKSVEATSLYSVASLFPMLLMIAIHGFILGWQPWCFSRLTSKKQGYLSEITMGALFYCCVLPFGGLILAYMCGWLGPWVIGTSFLKAFEYVPLLIGAMVMQGLYLLPQSVLQFYQKINILAIISVVTIAIKILMNYYLIGEHGIIGVAVASLLTYGFIFLATGCISIRLIRSHDKITTSKP